MAGCEEVCADLGNPPEWENIRDRGDEAVLPRVTADNQAGRDPRRASMCRAYGFVEEGSDEKGVRRHVTKSQGNDVGLVSRLLEFEIDSDPAVYMLEDGLKRGAPRIAATQLRRRPTGRSSVKDDEIVPAAPHVELHHCHACRYGTVDSSKHIVVGRGRAALVSDYERSRKVWKQLAT
jgi:hypothetical protein